jgi:type I restriction enzyme S subunit
MPESWEEISIGDFGDCITGTTPKTSTPEYYSPQEVDFIAPADLGKGKYIYSSEKKISRRGLAVARCLPKDSIMCVCIGSSIGKTGMTTLEESCTNQQINSIVCSARFNPNFVYYLLTVRSEYWKSHATFGPVPILSKGRFCDIRTHVPRDKQEQDRIAEMLCAVDARIESLDKKMKPLRDLFHTLLYQLMTAQIRVNDVDLSELGLEAEASLPSGG